jgi:hypothetical protein
MRIDGQTDRQTDRQTEGSTDMTNLIATFRNFGNAPENDRIFVAQAFGTTKKTAFLYGHLHECELKNQFFSLFRFI